MACTGGWLTAQSPFYLRWDALTAMCEKIISGVLDERERRLADGAAVWIRRTCSSEGAGRLCSLAAAVCVCLYRPTQVAPLDEAVRAAYASFEGFAPQDPLLLSAYFNVLNSFIPHLARNPTLLRGYVEKVYGYAAYAQPGEGVTAAGRFEGSETSQVVRRTACHNWLKLCMCAADTLLVCVKCFLGNIVMGEGQELLHN
jgi:hypothetical protein